MWSCRGCAVYAQPVPIKNPVGRVAILLNLEHHVARADSVEPPTRDKNITVRVTRNPMQKLKNFTGGEGRFEIASEHPMLETDVEAGVLRLVATKYQNSVFGSARTLVVPGRPG